VALAVSASAEEACLGQVPFAPAALEALAYGAAGERQCKCERDGCVGHSGLTRPGSAEDPVLLAAL
jgi:hypothetical protein